jgi:hypothetical protein
MFVFLNGEYAFGPGIGQPANTMMPTGIGFPADIKQLR